MNKAKIFKNGESQAVRLPKEFRFLGTEVLIRKEGDSVILTPLGDEIESLRNVLDGFSKDLIIERNQPTNFDKREDLL